MVFICSICKVAGKSGLKKAHSIFSWMVGSGIFWIPATLPWYSWMHPLLEGLLPVTITRETPANFIWELPSISDSYSPGRLLKIDSMSPEGLGALKYTICWSLPIKIKRGLNQIWYCFTKSEFQPFPKSWVPFNSFFAMVFLHFLFCAMGHPTLQHIRS